MRFEVGQILFCNRFNSLVKVVESSTENAPPGMISWTFENLSSYIFISNYLTDSEIDESWYFLPQKGNSPYFSIPSPEQLKLTKPTEYDPTPMKYKVGDILMRTEEDRNNAGKFYESLTRVTHVEPIGWPTGRPWSIDQKLSKYYKYVQTHSNRMNTSIFGDRHIEEEESFELFEACTRYLTEEEKSQLL